MNALRICVLATALTVCIAAPAAAKPGKLSPSGRMIQKINKVRAGHGLRALRQAPRLARSSRGYARRLIRTDVFAHGSSYAQAGFRRSGEILALRRGWSRRPGPPVRQWLGSPSHRALIFDPSFRYIGAGPARGRFGGRPTTIWVVHFGAH